MEGSSEVGIELSSSASTANRPSPFPDALRLAVADRMLDSIKVTEQLLGSAFLGLTCGVGRTFFGGTA